MKHEEFVKEYHLYMAKKEGKCVICGKAIVPGQASGVVYDYQGGQAHGLCEQEYKKNVEVMRVKGHLLILGTEQMEEVQSETRRLRN